MLHLNQITKIKTSIRKKGYYILKNDGKFLIKDIITSLNLIKKKCVSKRNIKKDLKNKYSNPLKIKNYQRHLVGEFGETHTLRANNYIQIINPLWCNDNLKLKKYFIYMCKLRNLLIGKNLNFCIDKPVGNLYSLTRVQYYPSGGGFMASHRDSRGSYVVKNAGLKNYIQILLLMSKKGRDFKTGGGFIIKNGKRIIHDDTAESGDIVIYDGKIEHGVETIDKERQLNDDSKILKGRFALLCNFYKAKKTAPRNLK